MKLLKGEIFPDFTLKDDKGLSFNLLKDVKSKFLVIYFYPKDNTPGCTKQACYFRDYYSDFENLDCEIIGISGDSQEKHFKFKESYSLPFRLLTDKKNELRNKLGLPKDFVGLSPGRITFLINSEFQILFIFRSSLNMKSHITKALNFLKKYKSKMAQKL